MTYIDDDAELIRQCLPPETEVPKDSERLFRLYAVLMRTKRMRTTAADVHDAWTAWQQELDPNHESLKPYWQLPQDVQAEDEPFLTAIHQAASLVIESKATDHEMRIRSTFPDLDSWSRRFRNAYRPATGSVLALDDQDWTPQSISQLAVSSMVAACEHLEGFQAHVESGDLYIFAHETLLRTAILSSAQAVWLLGPEAAHDRVANARTLAAHIDTEHMKFLRDLEAFGPDPSRDLVASRVQERLAELVAKRKEAGQGEKFEATRVIRTAVGYLSEDEKHAAEVVINWRSGSAAAHGLGWMVLGRGSNRQTSQPDADGLVGIEVRADIDVLASTYMSAYWLLRAAHELLDRRGSV